MKSRVEKFKVLQTITDPGGNAKEVKLDCEERNPWFHVEVPRRLEVGTSVSVLTWKTTDGYIQKSVLPSYRMDLEEQVQVLLSKYILFSGGAGCESKDPSLETAIKLFDVIQEKHDALLANGKVLDREDT